MPPSELSPIPPVDAFYEWLLSDAPAAREERAYRRRRSCAEADVDRAQVTVWCSRTLDEPGASPHLRDLAEVMQRLTTRAAVRDAAEAEVSDDEWVQRERTAFETARRVAGDHDYRYPGRYLDTEAARQPMPDERVAAFALRRGDRVRLGPDQPPAVVADVDACRDQVRLTTTDGRCRCYPVTAWVSLVHDDRCAPSAVPDSCDVARARPRDGHIDLRLER